MSSQQLAKVPSIDPEFAAAYEEANTAGATVQRVIKPSLPPPDSAVDDEDPLLALKRIAENNMRTARKSSECEDGFDRVENDVSNVIKTCWDFVTR